jgi:hypothetical protein
MSENCINCKFYVHTGDNGPNSGECRFDAPKALDVNAFAATARKKYHVSMANIRTDDDIASGILLPLYPAQFPPPAPDPQLLPTALNAVGLNSDTVCPFAIPRGFSLTGIAVNYSLANCGAPVPASSVDLDVIVCEVAGTGNTNEHTISIPLPNTYVGAQANLVDNFHDTFFSTENNAPYWSHSLVGAYLDLTTASADKISEIRNPVIGLEFSDYIAPGNPWGIIRDENTGWCGDFAPKPSTPINIKCWQCHYLNAPDPEMYDFGFCQRYAPTAIATASLPGFWKTVDERLWEYTYPRMSNAKYTDWCGKFKKSTKPALPE